MWSTSPQFLQNLLICFSISQVSLGCSDRRPRGCISSRRRFWIADCLRVVTAPTFSFTSTSVECASPIMRAWCFEKCSSRVALAGNLSIIIVRVHLLLGDNLVSKFGRPQLECGQAVFWVLHNRSSAYLRTLGYFWQSFHVGQLERVIQRGPDCLLHLFHPASVTSRTVSMTTLTDFLSNRSLVVVSPRLSLLSSISSVCANTFSCPMAPFGKWSIIMRNGHELACRLTGSD